MFTYCALHSLHLIALFHADWHAVKGAAGGLGEAVQLHGAGMGVFKELKKRKLAQPFSFITANHVLTLTTQLTSLSTAKATC